MSDLCDAQFFREYVWPLLVRDVKYMTAVDVEAVAAGTEKEFLSRAYRHSRLLQPASTDRKKDPERELKVAAMQLYPLMYEFTIRLATVNTHAPEAQANADETEPSMARSGHLKKSAK